MNKINLETSFEDERGKIIDLLSNENINAITIVTFKKGAIRANHYHKHTFQYNYVLKGKILLATQVDNNEVNKAIFSEGEFFVSPPNEKHALQGIEDSEVIVFTKGPRGGKEYESDTYRLETPLL